MSSLVAASAGGVGWRCRLVARDIGLAASATVSLAVSAGGVGCGRPSRLAASVAVSVGSVGWRCRLVVSAGGVGWRCRLAVSASCRLAASASVSAGGVG
jgi:hypothetical protein